MKILLDSDSGESPPGTEFKDKDSNLLHNKHFYQIDPYSSPHAYRGIRGGYAVFENWEESQILLNHTDTAKRVYPYTAKRLEKFLLLLLPRNDETLRERIEKDKLITFLKEEISQWNS